jgi:HEAT repeat protein
VVTIRPKIFDFLLRAGDVAADHALIAGIPELEPALQSEAVNILLSRNRDAGLEALPALLDRLGEEAKAIVIANTAKLFGSLRVTIRSNNVKTRLNTVEIIRRSGNLRLAYLAAHAVHDGAPPVRAEAAVTLHHLANKHYLNYTEITTALRDVSEPDGNVSQAIVGTLKLLREERQYLIAALAEAIACYESHYRPQILEAAMIFADELEGKLFQHTTVKRSKLAHAMLDIFSASVSPQMAPFAYVALCYPELRRKIIATFANSRDPEFFTQVIRYHWLARDPSIRKNLLAVRSVTWLEAGMEAAFALPPDAAALAPGWLLSLGIPSGQKVAILLNFLLINNAPANRAAVWALIKIDTPAATLALQSALDHEDPDIRKLAEREIAFRCRRDSLIVRRPRKDRPEAWSNLLDRSGLSEEFDDLWHHFERLNPVQAKAAGEHAITYVPGFMTQLQVKLRSAQTIERLRGLRMLLILNLIEQFKNEVFNVANDQSPEIRAAAMTILGRLGDVTSRRILERALGDDEPCVQAAVIDALDEMNAPRRVELLLPKTESEHAEVRAAAVRALLKQRVAPAAVALVTMLRDERSDHRCAALWIIDQLRLDYLVPRVMEIARSDKDARIARIAEHVARRLKRVGMPPAAAASPPVQTSADKAPQPNQPFPAEVPQP